VGEARQCLAERDALRSATGSFVPIPSNERMQSALLHLPIEITNELNRYHFGAVAREQSD
jgi:hypothetical protein